MVPKHLITAYIGYYELYEKHEFAAARELDAINRIQADKPKARLHIYLMWNGIVGFDETIYSICRTDTYTV